MPIDPKRNKVSEGSVSGRSSRADPWLGKTFGQCLIQRKIGRGGMGTVYLARHLTLNKPVAVKILRTDLPTDAQGVERFLREARAAACLDHSRIVHVYDAGQQEGVYYIVMQFVPGESLSARLRREGRLRVDEALRILRSVAEGIQHAHAHGIVHRDIKPDNILLDSDGNAKIVDFGLAYMIEGDPSLSRAGSVLGSPSFMSPEQAMGLQLDQRTDIYSMGATLYQMLTGLLPFQASTSIAVVCKVVNEPLRPPHEVNESIPPAISRFVCQLMCKDRENRIGSITEVLRQLNLIDSKEPSASPSSGGVGVWKVAGVVGVATILVACVTWLFLYQGSQPTASAVEPPPLTKPSTTPSTTSVPAPAPDKIDPEAAKVLLARFEEFKKAVGEGKLANLKALLDPAINDRGARSLRNRTAFVVQRIVTELGKGDWSHAKALDVWWQDASEGLAALMVQIPNDSQIRRQTWILKQGQWYLIPPSPKPVGLGPSGLSPGERAQ